MWLPSSLVVKGEVCPLAGRSLARLLARSVGGSPVRPSVFSLSFVSSRPSFHRECGKREVRGREREPHSRPHLTVCRASLSQRDGRTGNGAMMSKYGEESETVSAKNRRRPHQDVRQAPWFDVGKSVWLRTVAVGWLWHDVLAPLLLPKKFFPPTHHYCCVCLRVRSCNSRIW